VAIRIISTKTADHYKWGGDLGTDCDGWHLVKTPDFSVIEELMPPGTSERRHYHLHARQFFYVLDGVLTLEIDGQDFLLQAGEGIEVSPNQPHQAFNRSPAAVLMLVTSQPPSHGDRVDL
jgi:mannose-6-phosphate isomerase-like protein (cupin superfamily)